MASEWPSEWLVASPAPTPASISFNFSNISLAETCPADNLNCTLNETESVKRSTIAVLRMVASLLSIGGSLSIVFSICAKKQLSTPKLQPLLVLSVADTLLGLMWVLGALFWFSDVTPRAWCYLPSLPTVILECVTTNLTLVFAFSAYSQLLKTDVHKLLVTTSQSPLDSERVWSPLRAFMSYFLAWTVPLVLIMGAFGVLSRLYNMAANASACSCWCLPYFGNVMPLNHAETAPQALYFRFMRMLLASYGSVLGSSYFVVFVIMLVIYIRILRHIKKLRSVGDRVTHLNPNYGTIDNILVKSQRNAQRRVVYFLVIFLITGFFNFIFCCWFVIHEAIIIHRDRVYLPVTDTSRGAADSLATYPFVIYLLQSVTVPMQGFFNALVYGWTRSEFRQTLRKQRMGSPAAHKEDEEDLFLSESGGYINVGDRDRKT